MNRTILTALAVVIVIGAGYAAYTFLHPGQPGPQVATQPAQPPTTLPAPAPPPAAPGETRPAGPPLPPLAESDAFVLDALAALVGNPASMKLFRTDKVIHNLVVTVDSLPERRVPRDVMPLKPPAGKFLVAGSGGRWTVSPQNEHRYAPYVKFAEAIDARRLVALYARLYPLFQQAYADIGYPNGQFNTQLNATLDDLLDTPDVDRPIALVRPKSFYLYADPELEGLSIGEKIMLRLVPEDLKIVRRKLDEIKRELSLQMPAMQVDAED